MRSRKPEHNEIIIFGSLLGKILSDLAGISQKSAQYKIAEIGMLNAALMQVIVL